MHRYGMEYAGVKAKDFVRFFSDSEVLVQNYGPEALADADSSSQAGFGAGGGGAGGSKQDSKDGEQRSAGDGE